MLLSRIVLGAVMVASVATAAEARTRAPSLRDRQQAACYGDVQRLCSAAMPNVAKVTACMKPKKEMVSAPCQALWDVK